MVYEHYNQALLTLIIAALTDGLDGAIARMANQQTRIGAYLDPLADKLLLMSSFLTLSILHMIPVWAVILVVSRDVILLAGTLLARVTESSIDITPTILGKGTTLVQFCLYYDGGLDDHRTCHGSYSSASFGSDGHSDGSIRLALSLSRGHGF